MPSCKDIKLMAAYNAEMNQKLYAAAARLPHDELSAERKAFFGSILGTMNHLVAADTIWLQRFASHTGADGAQNMALAAALTLPKPDSLSSQAAANLPDLLKLRLEIDAIITQWAAHMREDDLRQPLVYALMNGERHSKNLGSVLLHFFNHQTHHRGQTTTLLSQAGVDIGVTDLLAWIPEQAAP